MALKIEKLLSQQSLPLSKYNNLINFVIPEEGSHMDFVQSYIMLNLPVTSPDDYRFLPPPESETQTAFALIERVTQNNAEYFGLYHPNVPPQKTQMIQQATVNVWLDVWSDAFAHVFAMMLQFMDKEEIKSIIAEETWLTGVEAVEKGFADVSEEVFPGLF